MNIWNLGKSEVLQIKSIDGGAHNIIAIAQDNPVHDGVNPAVANGYDIMSTMFATLQILSEGLNLKRSIIINKMIVTGLNQTQFSLITLFDLSPAESFGLPSSIGLI